MGHQEEVVFESANLNSLSLVLLVELHLWDEAWKKMSHVIYFQIFYRVAII